MRKRETFCKNVGAKGEHLRRKVVRIFCLEKSEIFRKIGFFFRFESKISGTGFRTPRPFTLLYINRDHWANLEPNLLDRS